MYLLISKFQPSLMLIIAIIFLVFIIKFIHAIAVERRQFPYQLNLSQYRSVPEILP